MNEVMEVTALPSNQEEFQKAMIHKIVDIGIAVKNISDQVRELHDQSSPQPASEALGEKIDNYTKTFSEGMDIMAKLPERISVHAEPLQKALEEHARLFEKPLEKSVHHRHFLAQPLLVLGGMIVVIIVLLFCWNNAWEKADRYETNDIKWRYVELTHDSLVSKSLNEADHAYQADPDQFRKDVVAEEQRRKELFANWMQVNEGNERIRELEKREKRH
jgi:hypothetical protein